MKIAAVLILGISFLVSSTEAVRCNDFLNDDVWAACCGDETAAMKDSFPIYELEDAKRIAIKALLATGEVDDVDPNCIWKRETAEIITAMMDEEAKKWWKNTGKNSVERGTTVSNYVIGSPSDLEKAENRDKSTRKNEIDFKVFVKENCDKVETVEDAITPSRVRYYDPLKQLEEQARKYGKSC